MKHPRVDDLRQASCTQQIAELAHYVCVNLAHMRDFGFVLQCLVEQNSKRLAESVQSEDLPLPPDSELATAEAPPSITAADTVPCMDLPLPHIDLSTIYVHFQVRENLGTGDIPFGYIVRNCQEAMQIDLCLDMGIGMLNCLSVCPARLHDR